MATRKKKHFDPPSPADQAKIAALRVTLNGLDPQSLVAIQNGGAETSQLLTVQSLLDVLADSPWIVNATVRTVQAAKIFP